jgi:hypothetical protein
VVTIRSLLKLSLVPSLLPLPLTCSIEHFFSTVWFLVLASQQSMSHS